MKDAKIVLATLSLEEKAALCDGADFWHLKGFEEHEIPSIMVCDGPHGLRKKDYNSSGSSLNNSVPAICFPTACTSACSWDPELLYEMGKALGNKCLKEKVAVLLGPGVNMKRSPLCGRNFEYFSEDPLLAGTLAASLINGVQSRGVGTSLKHYAANSQETRRMTSSSVVDERALREIYLTAFEIAVKNGKPWTVMNSYNKINGVHGSENKKLQTEILRDEWGYEGVVVSDWGAVNNRVKGLAAGNDLEMPSSTGSGTKKIIDAVMNGELDIQVLDERVLKILELIKKASDHAIPDYKHDEDADHLLARKIAARSMVLLKNDGLLPLDKTAKIAVIGEFAKLPRYQGAGSSIINPTKMDNAFEELEEAGCSLTYAQGYERSLSKAKKNPAHIKEAVEIAKAADTVLLFIGLTEDYESEGFDRAHMQLPEAHTALLEAVAAVNKNIIVVLAGGAPVELPWADKVNAILNSYLGGQGGAKAVADILLGKINPSGKLAETFPMSLDTTPSFNNFPGNPATVEYRESVYIGYRYYDTAKVGVRYPFGYGLSYTTFEYSGLELDKAEMADTDTLTVTFKVKNTGKLAGYETAQLYVADKVSTIFRPAKELKGFQKIWLEPGEEKSVKIELSKRAFAFWNIKTNDWCVESGEFDILVGASSQEIRLLETVKVNAPEAEIPDYSKSAPNYYTADVQKVPDDRFAAVLGGEIPPSMPDESIPLLITDNFENARRTKKGLKFYNLITSLVKKFTKGPAQGMALSIATQTPFRCFISMSGGVFSEDMAQGLLNILNGEKHGWSKILKGIPKAIPKIGPLLKNI